MLVRKNRHAPELGEAQWHASLSHSKELLSWKHIHPVTHSIILVTDEKILTMTTTKKNTQNKERTCSNQGKDIATNAWAHDWCSIIDGISQWVTSGWHCTSFKRVHHGVEIIQVCYRNVMLLQQFLPAIRQISSEILVFQQASAPAHRALRQSTFLPVTSPDVRFSEVFQSRLSSKFAVKYSHRYGGIFNYCFTRNLLLSSSTKEFWKSLSIWQSWRRKYSATFFPDAVYKVVAFWRRKRTPLAH